MKKNNMMRLASVLLVLVLLTTCAISGTFAKYVSTATAKDAARVAYWGWGSDATIEFDLFDGTYDSTVDSENDDNVVAPGTSKSSTFTFAYKPIDNWGKDVTDAEVLTGAVAINAPEVDYNFAIAFDVEGDYTDLDANPNFKWTLNSVEYNTVADLKTAVLNLAGTGHTNGLLKYEANTLPAAFATNTNDAVANTIGWTWTFETDADAVNDGMQADPAQDAKDTNMGNGLAIDAADPTDLSVQDLDDVKFAITITATQVD